MTIVESIIEVLQGVETGLTALDIYKQIIERDLYKFGAKNPANVVNGEIRRRCVGLDFPTAIPTKLFKIVGRQGKKLLFSLWNNSLDDISNKALHKEESDLLPEEKINEAFVEHVEIVQMQVLDRILNNSPAFFEHLVMDLLIKMGYGYDKTSGVVTGRSHDGGIDGIINEDKLGLDLIYVQAKRYNESAVGRKEIQAFVGAMENVQKGVFITTSKFTKEAIEFANRQHKSIKLIDGPLLADLLVKYQVGINIVKTYSLYKIDSDYYGD